MEELIQMIPTPKIPEIKIPSIPFPSMPSIPGLPSFLLPQFEFKPENIDPRIRHVYKLEFENIKVDDLSDPTKSHESDILIYFASFGFMRKYLLFKLGFKMI